MGFIFFWIVSVLFSIGLVKLILLAMIYDLEEKGLDLPDEIMDSFTISDFFKHAFVLFIPIINIIITILIVIGFYNSRDKVVDDLYEKYKDEFGE